MFRLPETFALTRRRFRDFRPLIPPSSYASPLLCAPHHALARRARVRRRSTQVRQPSACRLPAPPRPAPPYSYSLVSRETREDNQAPGERESDSARAARSFVAASVVLAPLALLRRRRPSPHTRTGHVVPRSCSGDDYSLVSRETREHRPLPRSRALAPGRVVPAQ